MIKVDWKLNGKKIRPDQIGTELNKLMQRRVEEVVTTRIRAAAGTTPVSIEKKGTNLKDLSFKVEGSEEAIQKVKTDFSKPS